jgi:hypothetical protein
MPDDPSVQIARLVARVGELQAELAAAKSTHDDDAAKLTAANAQIGELMQRLVATANLSDQIAELRAKYEAPLPAWSEIQPVTHYRCSDGTCHETVADAQRHRQIAKLVAAGKLSHVQAAHLVDHGVILVEKSA